MKIFILISLFSLSTLSFAEEVLLTREYTSEIKVEEMLEDELHETLEDSSSKFYKAFNKFAAEENFTTGENYDYQYEASITLDYENLVYAGGGKGGCCSHGTQHLLPIVAYFPGTGLNHEIVGFVKIRVSHELPMGDDFEDWKATLEVIGIKKFSIY